MKGRPKSAATRAKLSAALLGRPKSPEHRAALLAARHARPTVLEACRASAHARYRAGHLARKSQLEADRLEAWRRRDALPGVFRDVDKSRGYSWLRRCKGVPGISDGWSKAAGIAWSARPLILEEVLAL